MTVYWVKKDSPHRVTQVKITPQTLERIADLLGIPQAERGQFIGGTIKVSTSPPPPGGDASSSPPNAPPSPTSRRTRPRE
jgi:hypothetical protein